jgi:NAD(P)H dehydrogenase (quinone)
MKRARDAGHAHVEEAAALAFGSPTYYSYMSGELKMLFDNALRYKDAFYGKPAIAFATGNGGQLKCIQSIEGILEYFEAMLIQGSDILSAGLAVQGRPDEGALREARAVGRKLGDAGVDYACGLGRKNIIVGKAP